MTSISADRYMRHSMHQRIESFDEIVSSAIFTRTIIFIRNNWWNRNIPYWKIGPSYVMSISWSVFGIYMSAYKTESRACSRKLTFALYLAGCRP